MAKRKTDSQASLPLSGDEGAAKWQEKRDRDTGTASAAVEPERAHVDVTDDGPQVTGHEIAPVGQQNEEAAQANPPATAAGLREAALALPVGEMIPALEEYDARREVFRKFLNAKMVEGVHYGVPPGVNQRNVDPDRWRNKPSLYKAGADLIVDLCHVRADFAPDVESWQMGGSKPGTYYYLCRIIGADGRVLGQGRGAAVKKGDKADSDENAGIKKAQKRAKVDAVINTFSLSDLFTQDLEKPVQFDNPTPNNATPQVAPRESRPQVFTKAERLADLVKIWQNQNPGGSSQEWAQFVAETTGREFNTRASAEWTDDDVQIVSDKLHDIEEIRAAEASEAAERGDA